MYSSIARTAILSSSSYRHGEESGQRNTDSSRSSAAPVATARRQLMPEGPTLEDQTTALSIDPLPHPEDAMPEASAVLEQYHGIAPQQMQFPNMETYIDDDGDSILTDDTFLARKVFSVPELLELVLLNLPVKDILLLQRVALIWRDTVRSSTNLRQAIFLEPTKEPDIVALFGLPGDDQNWLVDNIEELGIEPLPENAKFINFCRVDQLPDGMTFCRVAALNPLLCRVTPLHQRSTIAPVDPMIEVVPAQPRLNKDGTYASTPELLTWDLQKVASCRNMLLTQPPTSFFEVMAWAKPERYSSSRRYFHDDGPVCILRNEWPVMMTCCGEKCCGECVSHEIRKHLRCPNCSAVCTWDYDIDQPNEWTSSYRCLCPVPDGNAVRLQSVLDVLDVLGTRTGGLWDDAEWNGTASLLFKDTREVEHRRFFDDNCFCVGTLVLSPDDWAKAQEQARQRTTKTAAATRDIPKNSRWEHVMSCKL